MELKSVKEEYEKLSKNIFPDLNILMLHGKMRAAEKENIMRDFWKTWPNSRYHLRRRSRRGCAERDRNDDRGRRPLRPGSALPIPRPSRPERTPVLLFSFY